MKFDEDNFPIYEPCDECEHKDEKHNWCNMFDFRIIGDCWRCPIMSNKDE